MHAISILCTLLLATLASTVSAAPTSPKTKVQLPICLSDVDAAIVAKDFGRLLSNYTPALANAVIASDFTDQSDSANTLINGGETFPFTLGALTFANKTVYEAMQGAQPGIPFEILNVWHTCDVVVVRWVSHMAPQQVQGIDVLVVEWAGPVSKAPGRWQIKTVYGEFNSGAWLIDLGLLHL